jgi:hypothetical protein
LRLQKLILVLLALLLAGAAARYLVWSYHLAQLDSAIVTVREMIALESKFAAAHPDRGFTCDLQELTSMVPTSAFARPDPRHRRNGYAFQTFGCSETHPVRRITILAIPDSRHNPVVCANESGIVGTVPGTDSLRDCTFL